MQMFVDGLCQLVADTWHAFEFVDTGADDFLTPPEVLQQFLALLGPDAGDGVKRRLAAGLAAAVTMGSDCEAVRFVADMLQQMQRRRLHRQCQLQMRMAENQGFLPCPPADALGDTHQQYASNTELGQYLFCLLQLAETAVDQQQIR